MKKLLLFVIPVLFLFVSCNDRNYNTTNGSLREILQEHDSLLLAKFDEKLDQKVAEVRDKIVDGTFWLEDTTDQVLSASEAAAVDSRIDVIVEHLKLLLPSKKACRYVDGSLYLPPWEMSAGHRDFEFVYNDATDLERTGYEISYTPILERGFYTFDVNKVYPNRRDSCLVSSITVRIEVDAEGNGLSGLVLGSGYDMCRGNEFIPDWKYHNTPYDMLVYDDLKEIETILIRIQQDLRRPPSERS